MLKATYDSEDEIPEESRHLFEERGGKWVMKRIEGLVTDADVQRVRRALDQEKEAHKATKERMAAWDELGDDPEEVRAKLDELPELRAKAENSSVDTEALKKAREERDEFWQRKYDKDMGKKDTLIADAEARAVTAETNLTNKTIADGLRDAALKMKITPSAIDDVLMHAGKFKVENDEIVTKESGLTPETWLEDEKDKRPHWYVPASGMGARGGKGAAGGNPFTRGKFDPHAANDLIRKDAAQADKLAQKAGFKGYLDAINKLAEEVA